METITVKKLKLKNKWKNLLILTLVFIASVLTFKLAAYVAITSERAIDNCINEGHSEYYCVKHLG